MLSRFNIPYQTGAKPPEDPNPSANPSPLRRSEALPTPSDLQKRLEDKK